MVRGSGKIVVFRDHDPEHMIETYIESNIGGKNPKMGAQNHCFPPKNDPSLMILGSEI